MQNKNSDNTQQEYIQLTEREVTKTSSDVGPTPEPVKMSYNQLNKTIFTFFREKDYETFAAFKEGYNKTVSEDYDCVDLLSNLNDLLIESMNSNKISVPDRTNLNNLCRGIQQLTRVYRQYETSMNKTFVAKLTGYILKLIRNNFHD